MAALVPLILIALGSALLGFGFGGPFTARGLAIAFGVFLLVAGLEKAAERRGPR